MKGIVPKPTRTGPHRLTEFGAGLYLKQMLATLTTLLITNPGIQTLANICQIKASAELTKSYCEN